MYIYICIHMKAIQCAHPPHHHSGFVETWLWMASGGIHTLLFNRVLKKR